MYVVKQVSQLSEHEPSKICTQPISTDITEFILNLPTFESDRIRTQIQHEVAGDIFLYAIETGRNFAKSRPKKNSQPSNPTAFAAGLIRNFFKVF